MFEIAIDTRQATINAIIGLFTPELVQFCAVATTCRGTGMGKQCIAHGVHTSVFSVMDEGQIDPLGYFERFRSSPVDSTVVGDPRRSHATRALVLSHNGNFAQKNPRSSRMPILEYSVQFSDRDMAWIAFS